MKTILAAAIALTFGAGLTQAEAAGCLKGAAVGGVAGHVAGHHGVLGAAAGCAVGHHEASKHARQAATTQPSNASAGTTTGSAPE